MLSDEFTEITALYNVAILQRKLSTSENDTKTQTQSICVRATRKADYYCINTN